MRTPTDAHQALRDKFGGSLPFGDVGTVLGGGTPKLKKPGAKKKAAARPKGAKPPRRGAAPKGGESRYAILVSDGGLEMAANRSQMVASIQELLSRGRSPDELAVYERIPFTVATHYTVDV